MKKAYRIKKNEHFQRVFKEGNSFANRQLVIFFLKKPGQEHFRIGLSVGTKIGNAVTRNRIKRYLRESFHSLNDKVLPTLDIVIIARRPTRNMNYYEVKSSLNHVLSRKHLYK